GAGRGLAGVATRLEGDVERGPPGAVACLAEGVDLGMRAAELFVPPLADDFATGCDHHCADHRIRLDMSLATTGELERELHEARVGAHWQRAQSGVQIFEPPPP